VPVAIELEVVTEEILARGTIAFETHIEPDQQIELEVPSRQSVVPLLALLNASEWLHRSSEWNGCGAHKPAGAKPA
jgi:hypothetical protein